MTLPTFIGIGAPRSGSTWLHELLGSHPDVFVPTRRKEVRFFDLYYDRGLQWYERFFPPTEQAGRYVAIGEISPTYLYCPDCPERIASLPSVAKLISTLRNPIDRAYSIYCLYVQTTGFTGTFEHFIALGPDPIQKGFYSRWLRNYLRHFNRDQILVLIFEHCVTDVPTTKEALAHFLGIQADRFSLTAGTKRVNVGYVPKEGLHRFFYALSVRMYGKLRDWDADSVVNKAKKGVKWLFGESSSLPPMKEETRKHLQGIYDEEIEELESLFEKDLGCWK